MSDPLVSIPALLQRPATAGAALGVAVLLSASMLLSQTLPGLVEPGADAVYPPAGAALSDLRPPPTPFEVASAITVARLKMQAATDKSVASLPKMPWTERGLADVEIRRDQIRYDEKRGKYVASVAGGRLAILSLDHRIQQHLEKVLGQYKEPGEAVVVIEPKTGRVLAMVDDSTGTLVGSGLASRATAFAASTFKVITGAALLESGKVSPMQETCYSGGGSGFGRDSLTYVEARDKTCRSFTDAMARSSNIIFGRLAHQNLTPQGLDAVASSFGFDQPIPFEMKVEKSTAAIPQNDEVEFARSAAGFRHTRMSPLHGAMIQAAIANEGMMMVPSLVDRMEDGAGKEVYQLDPKVWKTPVSPDVASKLLDTTSTTCTTGTARSYFADNARFPAAVRAWGKTGTLSNRNADGSEPDPFLTYSWFVGIGDRDGTRMAVGALVVNTPTWWIKGSFLGSEAIRAALPALDQAGLEIEMAPAPETASSLDSE
jgi:cell division protein FtsI/penicillin-binding protein 2